MTEEEKKTLVDAVNCKYPHQNLTEIYYNTEPTLKRGIF